VDYGLDIHSVYEQVRWITDQILIWCMNWSGRLPTEYSVTVCRGQAEYRPDIYLVYEWVRQITLSDIQ
jgi:hypothetical protein